MRIDPESGRILRTYQTPAGADAIGVGAGSIWVVSESNGTVARIDPRTGETQQINVGKDSPEYQALVSTLIMHPDDMKEIGVPTGSTVRVRSLWGETTVKCVEGKVPAGMIFIPYGPPTCHLMAQYTDGTGMPLSKGWEVEVELVKT